MSGGANGMINGDYAPGCRLDGEKDQRKIGAERVGRAGSVSTLIPRRASTAIASVRE